MRRLVVALALAVAAFAGVVVGWFAAWVIAGHDDRPYLTPDHRQLLDLPDA